MRVKNVLSRAALAGLWVLLLPTYAAAFVLAPFYWILTGADLVATTLDKFNRVERYFKNYW